MSVKGATNQTPINQIDQSPVPQGGASGVKEHKPPTFLKLSLFQNNSLSLTSNQKTSSRRSVGNVQIDAKKLGNQVANNLRLHGFEKNKAKMIGALVEHLQLENITKEKTDKTGNVEAATSDNTLSLLGKNHSKIGFAVRRFCNWIKGKKPDNEAYLKCKNQVDMLRLSLCFDKQERVLLDDFSKKIENNPGIKNAFDEFFPKELDLTIIDSNTLTVFLNKNTELAIKNFKTFNLKSQLKILKILQGDSQILNAIKKDNQSILNCIANFILTPEDEKLKTMISSKPNELDNSQIIEFIDVNIDFLLDYGNKNFQYGLKNIDIFHGLTLESKLKILEKEKIKKTFFHIFTKFNLLSDDSVKKHFNKLPMEAKKTFIEQNKDDIGFLSEFSKVYKEELEYDSFSGQPIPELLTAFKDAIVSNKDQIIKDPTILASADKASIFAVADAIKDDIPLQKALIQSYTHITKEIAEEALKTNNQESKLINQETTDNFAKLLKGEITQEDFGSIESVQILSDGARGFTFDFSCPSGKVTLTKEANERIDENGEKHFLSKQEILNTILEQSKNFTPDDKKALADFVTNCAVQGLFAGQIPGTTVCLKIDGDGVPFIKAQANPDGLKVNVVTKGTCKDTLGSVTFSDNSTLSFDKIDVEKNEFSLFYPTSIRACQGKAKEIKVLEINQKQGLPLTQEEKSTNDALRKIKNEDGLNGSVTIDDFNALMSNPQILNENIEFLDKNPAALRKIPKEILQTHIQNALNAKNEPLAKALTKALDYMDQTTFEKKLLKANETRDSSKSTTNSEPLVRFFTQDNTPTLLGNKNFEVLNDAIRQADVKFITKDGKEITIGGFKFNEKPQEALNDIKQQIKEKELEDAEIKALADFIANGYVQTYLNFGNGSAGPYCWDGDGKVQVTAQMSDKGLDVNVKTQGSDNTATIFTAPQFSKPARLEKTVNADVTFYYKGSIGETQGVVDSISVNHFEQEIGDVTFV